MLIKEEMQTYKIQTFGYNSLSVIELLGCIIKSDSEVALNTARAIYNDLGGLIGIKNAAIKDLTKYNLIGKVTATGLIAAANIAVRIHNTPKNLSETVSSSQSAFEVIYPELAHLEHEEFWILCLDRANKIKAKVCISKGGVAGTIVDPKIVFKKVLECTSSGLILCHNHPSGSLCPSHADLKLTKKFTEAGKLLDINVLDHIIVAGSSYYSFADNNEI